jgi:hypothetical protein
MYYIMQPSIEKFKVIAIFVAVYATRRPTTDLLHIALTKSISPIGGITTSVGKKGRRRQSVRG